VAPPAAPPAAAPPPVQLPYTPAPSQQDEEVLALKRQIANLERELVDKKKEINMFKPDLAKSVAIINEQRAQIANLMGAEQALAKLKAETARAQAEGGQNVKVVYQDRIVDKIVEVEKIIEKVVPQEKIKFVKEDKQIEVGARSGASASITEACRCVSLPLSLLSSLPLPRLLLFCIFFPLALLSGSLVNRCPKPQALSPKPQTLNPKLSTLKEIPGQRTAEARACFALPLPLSLATAHSCIVAGPERDPG
jgi:hypothetical protein